MRKLVSYFLLVTFIYQIVGFVGYFEFSHFQLKKEVKILLKRGVPKKDLIVFEFERNQMENIVWLKKNEFELNGNLFDVVRKHLRKDGSCIFECISDKQEELLFAHLKENISANLGDDHNPTPVSNWMKILQVPALLNFDLIQIPEFVLKTKKKNFYYYLENDSLKSALIYTPPPKIS